MILGLVLREVLWPAVQMIIELLFDVLLLEHGTGSLYEFKF